MCLVYVWSGLASSHLRRIRASDWGRSEFHLLQPWTFSRTTFHRLFSSIVDVSVLETSELSDVTTRC